MFTCQTAPRTLARAISLALGITTLPASASSWIGGSGDWDTASNWDFNTVPQGGGGEALLQFSDSLDRVITYNAAAPDYLTQLALDHAGGAGSLEFDLLGSNLDVGAFAVGINGQAKVVHSGTTVHATYLTVGRDAGSNGVYDYSGGDLWVYDLRLGEFVGSQGALTWTGGNFEVMNNLYVGQGGSGAFIQDSGAYGLYIHYGHSLVLGEQAGSEGVYEQRSGSISASGAQIIVGETGRGIYRQSGGEHNVDEELIAHSSGSEGTYELSGDTAQRWSSRTVVGDAGTGRFIQTGGSSNGNELIIGGAAGGVGDYQLSGGSLSAYSIVLGDQAGSHGTFTKAGSPSSVSLDFTNLIIGRNGSGHFILDNGGELNLLPHQTIILGEQAGSEGVFEQRDSNVTAYYYDGGRIIVGEGGRGTYRQYLGRHEATETIIGHLAGSEGTYELSGSTIDDPCCLREAEYYAERTIVGDAGTGHFMQTAGYHGAMDLIIGRSAGGVGDYQLSGGSVSASNLVIGQAAGSRGTFDYAGGDLWAWSLTLGDEAGSEGVFNAAAPGGRFDVANLIIGRHGRGTFIYEGGSPQFWDSDMRIILGERAGSEGVFEQRGGQLHGLWGSVNEPLVVGEAGRGVYRQTGDSVHYRYELILGHLAGSEGTYELSDAVDSESGYPVAPSFSAHHLVVGDAGTGHFLNLAGYHDGAYIVIGRAAGGVGDYQLSGGILNAGYLTLGEQAGSQGTFHWTAGQFDTGMLHIGQSGSGMFVQDVGPGKGLQLGPDRMLMIGEHAGGEGVFEQRSGDVMAHGAYVRVGDGGRGTYRQLDGLHDSKEVVIAHMYSSEGRYELAGDGASLHTLQRTVVGDDGVGQFVHSAGSHDTQELVLGRGTSTAAATGRYELNGVHADLHTARTVVGANGTGRFVHSEGSHNTQELIIGQTAGSSGEYELRGGRLETQTTRIGAVPGASGSMKVIGGTADWWNHGNVQVGADLFSQPDAGAALLELQDGALVRADAIIVGESGAVRGNGLIEADVTNNGVFAPGMSAGQLDIIGNYSQLAEGALSIEIGGQNPGIDHDYLDILGVATLAGTLSVNLLGDYQFSLGESFDILYANMVYGSFDSLLFPIFDGMTFDIFYDANTVRLTVVNAVPVPAAVWLFGSGVVVLMGWRVAAKQPERRE